MNDVTVLIYLICFVVLFAATFAYMWKMMSITLKESSRKPIHPEMENVKSGEKLLVFKSDSDFDDEEDDDDGIMIIR